MKNPRVAIFNDIRGDSHHLGCALVMERLEALIETAGGHVVFRWPYDRDWRKALDELPGQAEIDVIVVNGEGTMHGAPGRGNAVALAEIGALAKHHYDVPVALVNATIYNNDNNFYESIRYFHLIWLRDQMSCESANECGITAHYCPDLTLSEDWSETNTSRQNIGITGSVRPRDDSSLRKFASASGSEFVSMVENRRPTTKSFMTLSIGRHRKAWRLRKRFLDINQNIQPQTPAELISWISGKSLVVTGRYHTVTLCILTNTPFLYLESNTPKITALCEDVGLRSDRLIQQSNLPPTAQLAQFIAFDAFNDNEQKALSDFNKKSKNQFSEQMVSLTKLFVTAQSIEGNP